MPRHVLKEARGKGHNARGQGTQLELITNPIWAVIRRAAIGTRAIRPAWYGLIDEPRSGPRMTICVEIRNISVRYRQPSPAPPPPNDHHGGQQTCKDRRRKSRVGAIGIVGPSSHGSQRGSAAASKAPCRRIDDAA